MDKSKKIYWKKNICLTWEDNILLLFSKDGLNWNNDELNGESANMTKIMTRKSDWHKLEIP